MSMDPNIKSKVRFRVGDVGGKVWEEISVGGTDYAQANYGWPTMEGPCKLGDKTDCPKRREYIDPMFYFEHTKGGNAVTGNVFVPQRLWPSQYKFLFIDYVQGHIYNLIKDDDRECRSCEPPIPAYRAETFHKLERMVDAFFGPYKKTQALYLVSRRSEEKKIRRIYFTGSMNRSPVAKVTVSDKTVKPGWRVRFDGSSSFDPDGDSLKYLWDFGDGSPPSKVQKTKHIYQKRGVYTVEFRVTDSKGLIDETSIKISVGKLPTAKIISPSTGKTFEVGEIMRLRGSGVDARGNDLSRSQLFWEVRQHHGSHYHPILSRRAGNNFTLFPAPAPEDFSAATNSYLKVILYAVDKYGLITKVERNIKPRKVSVKVNSVPPGLKVLVDGNPVVTPNTITTWANHKLRLDIEDQPPYTFKSWSDGGARSHSKRVPVSSSTSISVTATFSKKSWPPLKEPVRECSEDKLCGRCEGHCENDDECQGSLVCFEKGGRDRPVRGCTGIDPSRTDWCTIA